MKIAPILAATLAVLPFTKGGCHFDDIKVREQRWWLAIHFGPNCMSRAGAWFGAGFGTTCIEIPHGGKKLKSLMFSIGEGYARDLGHHCELLIKSDEGCGGKTITSATHSWQAAKLSSGASKMKSVLINCTKRRVKRGGEDQIFGTSLRDGAFPLDDEGVRYEGFVNGGVTEAPEESEGVGLVESSKYAQVNL